jgi:protein-disulfide isomerase
MVDLRCRWLALIWSAATACAASAARSGPSDQPPVPPQSSRAVTVADRPIADPTSVPVPVSAADAQWGHPNAPVTIVELGDFQCPFCARVQATLRQIQTSYGPDQVRIVWKHNPLAFHELARPAHEAAATVFGLGGSAAFWKFHDRVFANQPSLGAQPFEQWAVESGIDRETFRRAYAARRYAAKVDADLDLARQIGASGAPAFRINGVEIVGAQPLDAFRRVIDEQLAEAKQLVGRGASPTEVYRELTKRNFLTPPPVPGAPNVPEDTTVWQVPVLADDPVWGPRDALVTMVEWADFQCPYSKQVEATLTELLRSYAGNLRLVWKDNPLEFHPQALPAAILARTAFEQRSDRAFWDVHDALFASAPDLDHSARIRIARQFGISIPGMTATGPLGFKLAQSADLAEDLRAAGTPCFFVNGVRLQGAAPIAKFRARIDAELDKARARLARGVPRAKLYEDIMRDASPPPPPERKAPAAPSASSATRGPADAKVVIQQWGDFQCPFSRTAAATMAAVEQEFGGSVRSVWRHLPLPFHVNAELAAEAAEEVLAQKGQAAFWQYHDRLFEAQGEVGGLERPSLQKLAVALGVDPLRFKAALDSGRHRAKVAADADAARHAGIQGTPSFVINGYFLGGAQQLRSFRRTIRRAIADSKRP